MAGAATVSRPAGKKIRAAMLGTGHSHAGGKLKAMLDLHDYFEVAGVSEPDAALRAQRQSAALYQGQRWLSEEELLGDASVELVVVETAVPDLPAAGRKVIAAGKHLHLDKPPSHELAPFRELIEEARRKKLLVQTGYIWRRHQGINAAFEAARQGWLGQVYLLRGTINTDLETGARAPLARYRGGMMFELGGHLIDRVVELWGRPREVRSWLRHDTGYADQLADNTLAVFEYERSLAVVSSAARMPGHTAHRSFELIGTDGAMVIQPIEPGARMRVSMREARGPYKAGWQEIQMPEQTRYIGDFRALALALVDGQPLKHSYEHELLVQETLLRAST